MRGPQQRDAHQHRQQRQNADGNARYIDSELCEIAGLKAACVRREYFLQQILQHNRQAEGQQQRGERAAAHDTVEQQLLHQPTNDEHRRDNQRQRGNCIDAEQAHGNAGQIGPDHDQIAMRDIDHAHHAEAETKPKPEQGVQRAEHQAVQQGLGEDLHVKFRNRLPRRARNRRCRIDLRAPHAPSACSSSELNLPARGAHSVPPGQSRCRRA